MDDEKEAEIMTESWTEKKRIRKAPLGQGCSRAT